MGVGLKPSIIKLSMVGMSWQVKAWVRKCSYVLDLIADLLERLSRANDQKRFGIGIASVSIDYCWTCSLHVLEGVTYYEENLYNWVDWANSFQSRLTHLRQRYSEDDDTSKFVLEANSRHVNVRLVRQVITERVPDLEQEEITEVKSLKNLWRGEELFAAMNLPEYCSVVPFAKGLK